LRGDPERDCPSLCSGEPLLLGGAGGVELALRHRIGFRVEVVVGYSAMQETFSRALLEGSSSGAHYVIEQTIRATGPSLELMTSFERAIAGHLSVRAGVGGALFFAQYSNQVTGVGGQYPPSVPLEPAEHPAAEVAPLVALNVGVVYPVGRLRLRAGARAWFLPTWGPEGGGPDLSAAPGCSDMPAAPCPPTSTSLQRERLRGPGYVLMPELAALYAF
jgi:hypothetical protein